ncbi:molybdate ABC transporter substrate-binding protein [Magnetococcus sp. PR-3]|uniref:molybdate ABC transporter substrate-binding protein n=1 Tax=Magnetococcus sp. PR-3 TaxID=3120355 RepID=UPI002FCE6374
MHFKPLLALLLFLLVTPAAQAAEARIAIAANFTAVAKQIAQVFHQESGHTLRMSFGSTGKLYTQIIHGAPFDLFLAADSNRPERLEKEGKTVSKSRFTYATGRLVLWGRDLKQPEAVLAYLKKGQFRKLALANPKTAPYGAAALQTLSQLKLDKKLRAKMIRGDSIAQTFQFVATGNAQLGFVAASQVARKHPGWRVPQSMHLPLSQQAVLLKRGANNPAAKAFLTFIKQQKAQQIITSFGYGVESME